MSTILLKLGIYFFKYFVILIGMETKLLELRKNKKLLQREVAAACDMTTSAYGSYEKGDREPNLAALCKLADFYGVSIDELLGRGQTASNNSVPEQKYIQLFEQLNLVEQQQVIGYIEGLLFKRENKSFYDVLQSTN